MSSSKHIKDNVLSGKIKPNLKKNNKGKRNRRLVTKMCVDCASFFAEQTVVQASLHNPTTVPARSVKKPLLIQFVSISRRKCSLVGDFWSGH